MKSRAAFSVTVSVFIIVAIIGVATAGLIVYGIEFGNTATSPATNCCTTYSNPTDRYFYPSDINSSVSCNNLATNTNVTGFGILVSNIESYPEFVALEQGRSGYTQGGEGCYYSDNETHFQLSYYYIDTTQPFRVCGNGTAYPEYYIDVTLFLTASGYDLSQSKFSTRYYDSSNMTVSCTTQSAAITTATG